MRRRKHIALMLAALLLLLCLSGVNAGAGTIYYNEDGVETTSSFAVVTLTWSVVNNTINVNMNKTWDPENLCYQVTEVSVADVLCTPTLQIDIENNSTEKYCQSTVCITPCPGFVLAATTPNCTVSRNEIDVAESIQQNKVYPCLNDDFSESFPTTKDTASGELKNGPWDTATKRQYLDTSTAEEKITNYIPGTSTWSMTFTVQNPTLKAALCNPASWTDLTFSDGGTVQIADVTVTIKMVAVPDAYVWPPKE